MKRSRNRIKRLTISNKAFAGKGKAKENHKKAGLFK